MFRLRHIVEGAYLTPARWPVLDAPVDLVAVRSTSVRRRRHIQSRVAVEEAVRNKTETQANYRHHRPVLCARDVVASECVPDDDIRRLDRSVGLGPFG